jgi:hypothetical protein
MNTDSTLTVRLTVAFIISLGLRASSVAYCDVVVPVSFVGESGNAPSSFTDDEAKFSTVTGSLPPDMDGVYVNSYSPDVSDSWGFRGYRHFDAG